MQEEIKEEEIKKVFSQNLRRHLAAKGKQPADIVKELGISFSTVSNWINGQKFPRMGKVELLAHWLGIEKSDLIEDKTQANETNVNHIIRIPVLGRIAAGIPVEAVQEIIDWEELNTREFSDGEYFGLVINGDSMEPRFKKGDVIIVRKQNDADDGDIVVAMVDGTDATCKRLRKYENGTICLQSTNPAYDPMYFTPSEIDSEPVIIMGKVKELRAKF